ncbi:SDR family NAD(P)-dependent oxidoreductase [Anaerolineales bacterium HSG24]|nr:SDR family NAD(P)-dependent oxidoreductase [Anaerolineales bacterium HSG24]
MDKRICLITGANSGIGKASAIQIAEKGYRVIIACRNRIRGEAALQEIKEKSGSDSIELMLVDMSLQASVGYQHKPKQLTRFPHSHFHDPHYQVRYIVVKKL